MYAMGGSMKRAGAETMIMQYLRQLVKDPIFEFSILVHGNEKGDYDDELKDMGIPIFHAPVRGKHPFTYSREVAKILYAHPVDIIHCNMDNASGYFLKIAKSCGIPIRIAHSHTTKILTKNVVKKIFGEISKKEIHKVATNRLACSKKAGDWLFGDDKYIVINNAIDLDSYSFNLEKRIEFRNKLHINDSTLVLCHIGSFTYPKNHKGLLNIFKQLIKDKPDSKLLLAGVGPLMEPIKHMTVQLGLQNQVVFLGLCSDIPRLLQASDVFVMPSLMEGLPVAGIEAQAAGIPCLFSESITPEICMTPMAKRIPLNNKNEWIKELLSVRPLRDFKNAQKLLTDSGYNIVKESGKLSALYKKWVLLYVK